MPWARRRVKVGQLYGAGSLRHATRFVIGTKNSGRTVVFRVGPTPPCAPTRLANTWKEGEVREMSKKDFFRWVDKVAAELSEHVADNTQNPHA